MNALREIAKELGKKKWNFSLNPCGGDPSWNTNVTDTGSQFKNSVLCDCSYPGGVCHVVEMYVVLFYNDIYSICLFASLINEIIVTYISVHITISNLFKKFN